MRKYVSFFWSILLSFYSFSQEGMNPDVWLKAGADLDGQVVWPDFSGNSNDAQSSSPLSLSTINYNPALSFDGDGYLSVHYNIDSLNDLTVFSIYQPADTLERAIWSTESSIARNVLLTTKKSLGPDSVFDSFTPAGLVPVSNGVFQRWENSTDRSEEVHFTIGKAVSAKPVLPFKGAFSEIIIYDRVLSFLEKVQVETYLSLKYGISKSSGNYVSANEEVLWDRKKFEDFGEHIMGIGRDDYFGLYQKQTVSTSDTTGFLTLSAGPAASSNAENNHVIAQGDFILFGDNGGANIIPEAEEPPLLEVLDRKWLVSVTGNSAAKLETSLQADWGQLALDSIGYWLVVNRTGSDFQADNLEYILPDSITTDSIAYFNSLAWDMDLSGTDVFSFAKAKALFAKVLDIKKPLCTSPGTGEASFKIVAGEAPFRYRVIGRSGSYDHYFNGGTYVTEKGLEAGDYKLTITDANGSEFERTFSIGIQDEIVVDLGPDVDLLQNDSVLLDATEFVPDSAVVSYEWRNNFGFTSNEPKITVQESGIYTLYVTNSDGCVFSGELIISGSPFEKLAVYPTISQDGFYSVNVSLAHEDDVTVKVYDMAGNISSSKVGSGRSEYRFEGVLPGSGMHMIVIETPEGFSARKVIMK